MNSLERRKKEFRFEQLEDRQVLNGAGFGAMVKSVTSLGGAKSLAPLGAGGIANVVGKATPGAGIGSLAKPVQVAGTHLTATLTDPTGTNTATGTVFYNQGNQCGKATTMMVVTVSGATANSSFDVTLTTGSGDTAVTTTIGAITTDASGKGKLILSSNPKTGSSEVVLPTDFPASLAAGATVSIGSDLTGTLASAPKPTGNGQGDVTITRVATTLSDATGVDKTVVKASYTTVTKDDQSISIFNVCVSGGTADATLDVKVGDTTVGIITLDAKGRGRLTFTTNGKGPGATTFPTGFPTVTDQTAINVGSLSGILATVTTPLKPRGRH
jgi:hypothetical protein